MEKSRYPPQNWGRGDQRFLKRFLNLMFFFLGVYRLQPDECRPRHDMLLEKMYPLFSRFLSNHNPLALNFSGDMMILQVGVRTLDAKKKQTKKPTFRLGGGMTDFAHLVDGFSHIVHKYIYIYTYIYIYFFNNINRSIYSKSPPLL